MTDNTSPEKSPWGWKALIIAFILSGIFLGFFYLAITNEPDYMPSQQTQQNSQQHAFKNAPAMSEEAMAKAQADKEAREARAQAGSEDTTEHATADEHDMSADEHAKISSEHGH